MLPKANSSLGRFMQFPKVREIIRSLFPIVVILSTLHFVNGQTLQSKLTQNVVEFDSESTSTIEQLVELAKKFQIPMGIEWLYMENEKPARPIHIRNVAVQDVLRAILQQQPGYQFTRSNGIVHVFWPSLIDDPLNFLNLRVSEFAIERESLFGAQHKLRTSIQQLLHPSPGYGGGYGGAGLNDDFDVRKITFSGTNLTVRQILGKIATEQGNALWVVRLKWSQMMNNEPFHAQTASLTTDDAASNFFWQFIPLKQIKN
jgi:hypothetical protein